MLNMIREDVLFMITNQWEPSVPTTGKIKKQVEKKSPKMAGSVRMALGKLLGEKSHQRN